MSLDAAAWAEWQRRDDVKRTRRFPWLLAVKRAKMGLSAHAFLRGSAPLFQNLVAEMALGPMTDARAWTVGDMHVENAGAYRTDADEKENVFDLNDFDGTCEGPVVNDVLRLSTSVLLTARGAAFTATQANGMAQSVLEAWAAAAQSGRTSQVPAALRRLCKQAADKDLGAYLDERAPLQGKARRFERGERYRSLDSAWKTKAAALLQTYMRALGERAPQKNEVELVDVAQRIAGTGSLGCARLAYVVRVGDAYRLFELKGADDAARLVRGARALVAAPPRGLAALPGSVNGVQFVGRRLEPQQQKLNLAKVPRDEYEATFAHVASLLGRAHRRSATQKLPRWSATQLRQLALHAATLAGAHEAIYLASHVAQ